MFGTGDEGVGEEGFSTECREATTSRGVSSVGTGSGRVVVTGC